MCKKLLSKLLESPVCQADSNFFLQACFSDECTFQLLSDKKQYVIQRPGEKFNKDCVLKTINIHHQWWSQSSVPSSKGLRWLDVVEGTMQRINTLVTIHSALSAIQQKVLNISCPERDTNSWVARKFTRSQPNFKCMGTFKMRSWRGMYN